VTVRRAIAGLVDDGVLIQRHGAGTFVAERIVKSFSRLTGFTDDLRARGLKPRVRFLERGSGEVTPAEALALHLSPGTRVVRMRRLRYADNTPLALEDTSVPQSMLRDPKRVRQSLYDTLEKLGCRPVRALQRLRAVALDAAQAKLLDLPPGSPALAIEREQTPGSFGRPGSSVPHSPTPPLSRSTVSCLPLAPPGPRPRAGRSSSGPRRRCSGWPGRPGRGA